MVPPEQSCLVLPIRLVDLSARDSASANPAKLHGDLDTHDMSFMPLCKVRVRCSRFSENSCTDRNAASVSDAAELQLPWDLVTGMPQSARDSVRTAASLSTLSKSPCWPWLAP